MPKNTGRGTRVGALGNDYGKWPIAKRFGANPHLWPDRLWRRLLQIVTR